MNYPNVTTNRNYGKNEPYYGYTPEDDFDVEGMMEAVLSHYDLSDEAWEELEKKEQEEMITDFIFQAEENNAANQAEDRAFWND